MGALLSALSRHCLPRFNGALPPPSNNTADYDADLLGADADAARAASCASSTPVMGSVAPPALYEAALVGDWDAVIGSRDDGRQRRPDGRSAVHSEPSEAAHAAASFVDAGGNAALHVACRRNPPPSVVAALIEANPHAVGWTTNKDGLTPLHFACYCGAEGEVVRLLLGRMGTERALDTSKDGATDHKDHEGGDVENGISGDGSEHGGSVTFGDGGDDMHSHAEKDKKEKEAAADAEAPIVVRFILQAFGVRRAQALQPPQSQTQSSEEDDDDDISQTDRLLPNSTTISHVSSEPLLPPDARGRTPLHCACASPRSTPGSPHHHRPYIIRLLLLSASNPASVATQPDGRGRTPLDLVVDDYSEEIDDVLGDAFGVTQAADACLEEGGSLHECWAVMSLLLTAATCPNVAQAKEKLAMSGGGGGRNGEVGSERDLQAIHSACKSAGEEVCPKLFARLARKIVRADVDRTRIGKVSELRAQWERRGAGCADVAANDGGSRGEVAR